MRFRLEKITRDLSLSLSSLKCIIAILEGHWILFYIPALVILSVQRICCGLIDLLSLLEL